MAISQKLQEVYAANPSGAHYMEAFSIDHPALPNPLHLTSYRGGFKGNAAGGQQDFEYVPFSIKLPDKDTSGSQSITITVANDEQSLIDDIEIMSSQPYQSAKCWYRVYLTTDTDSSGYYNQQLNPAWRYDISSVVVSSDIITIVASRENMHNRSWPRQIYRADKFPGLDK